MSPARSSLSLVADIGGTNTRVALAQGHVVDEATIKRFANAKYPGLESILLEYVDAIDSPEPAAACVAIAGPVRDGVGTMTNLSWSIDREMLKRATGADRVAILNDLQAQGHALGHIPQDNIRTIIAQPDASPQAARLVVGVGTGFNAAPVYETASGRLVPPSECGHANLPIRTEADLRLCHFVETAHGFPAVEDVLSGRGLERCYSWIGHEAGTPQEASAADIMAAHADGSDPRARAATSVFTRILGTVVGNLSLIHLPFGGVYLVGGVSRAFAPYLHDLGFDNAFRDKGRFAGFMSNFGVSVIEDDYAALTGCAAHLEALG